MTQDRRAVPPLNDLTGWDRLPERYEPLAGQMDLFDSHTAGVISSPEPSGRRVLFDRGHDLPGASERDQRIIWDVE